MINLIIAGLCILCPILSEKAEYAILFNFANALLAGFIVFKTMMFMAVLNKKETFKLNLGKKTIEFKLISKMHSYKERASERCSSIYMALIGILMICGPLHMVVGVLLATTSIFMIVKLMEFDKNFAK